MSGREIIVGGKALSSLRVVDLKEELDKRGLSKSGSKKELSERLRLHLQIEKHRQEGATKDEEQLPNISVQQQLANQNPFLRDYFASQKELYHSQKTLKKLYEEEARRESEPEASSASADEGSDSPAKEKKTVSSSERGKVRKLVQHFESQTNEPGDVDKSGYVEDKSKIDAPINKVEEQPERRVTRGRSTEVSKLAPSDSNSKLDKIEGKVANTSQVPICNQTTIMPVIAKKSSIKDKDEPQKTGVAKDKVDIPAQIVAKKSTASPLEKALEKLQKTSEEKTQKVVEKDDAVVDNAPQRRITRGRSTEVQKDKPNEIQDNNEQPLAKKTTRSENARVGKTEAPKEDENVKSAKESLDKDSVNASSKKPILEPVVANTANDSSMRADKPRSNKVTLEDSIIVPEVINIMSPKKKDASKADAIKNPVETRKAPMPTDMSPVTPSDYSSHSEGSVPSKPVQVVSPMKSESDATEKLPLSPKKQHLDLVSPKKPSTKLNLEIRRTDSPSVHSASNKDDQVSAITPKLLKSNLNKSEIASTKSSDNVTNANVYEDKEELELHVSTIEFDVVEPKTAEKADVIAKPVTSSEALTGASSFPEKKVQTRQMDKQPPEKRAKLDEDPQQSTHSERAREQYEEDLDYEEGEEINTDTEKLSPSRKTSENIVREEVVTEITAEITEDSDVTWTPRRLRLKMPPGESIQRTWVVVEPIEIKSFHIDTELLKKFYPEVKPISNNQIRLAEAKEANVERKADVQKPVEEQTEAVTVSAPEVIPPERQESSVPMQMDFDNVDKDPPTPPKQPLSEYLILTNLVRPYTLAQLKELLQRTGAVIDIWVNKIKSTCIAKFANEDQSFETRAALHGIQWPPSNPKSLVVDYTNAEKLSESRKTEAGIILKQQVESPRGSQPIREWDLGKRIRSRSPTPVDRHNNKDGSQNQNTYSPQKRHSPSPKRDRPSRPKDNSKDVEMGKALDELFRKTMTAPCIFWLPLTNEQIEAKEEMRRQRMAERERRIADMSRMNHGR